MSDKHIKLSQLAVLVKEVINISFSQHIWVKAEISELHENRNGNCYLELIEKDNESDKIIAKFRAIIWDKTYRLLKPYFESTTHSNLKAGINVLVLVKVEYNEVYGISLQIIDIDPTYTIGDLEQRRALVIQQLVSDGVFEMNKELEFPLVPQRIAIISSDTAAGYEDFCNQLNHNPYGFKYKITLFKAFMQGDLAEQSIIQAMEKIPVQQYDVLVITRGGGSKSDLACFDHYDLANNIAQFPLPVIAAIGHERDTSVADLVAHTRVKTPTAAAEYIIQKTAEYWQYINSLYNNVTQYSSEIIEKEFNKLEQATKTIRNVQNILKIKKQQLWYNSEKINWTVQKNLKKEQQSLLLLKRQFNNITKRVILLQHKQLSQKVHQLANVIKVQIKMNEQNLHHIEKTIDAYNPKHVLARGYSITMKNGKVVKAVDFIKNDDIIETILSNGKIESKVIK
ncbi:MAG: exodeoxyribonuclease VII large subunit [Bacteroidales bacterium]|nr:exodeoxyribonuclease VII large subunit [Bacteroidales bacterium]